MGALHKIQGTLYRVKQDKDLVMLTQVNAGVFKFIAFDGNRYFEETFQSDEIQKLKDFLELKKLKQVTKFEAFKQLEKGIIPENIESLKETLEGNKEEQTDYKKALGTACSYLIQNGDTGAIKRLQKLYPELFKE